MTCGGRRKEKGTSSDGEKIAAFVRYHKHDQQSRYQQRSPERLAQDEDLRDDAHPQNNIAYKFVHLSQRYIYMGKASEKRSTLKTSFFWRGEKTEQRTLNTNF